MEFGSFSSTASTDYSSDLESYYPYSPHLDTLKPTYSSHSSDTSDTSARPSLDYTGRDQQTTGSVVGPYSQGERVNHCIYGFLVSTLSSPPNPTATFSISNTNVPGIQFNIKTKSIHNSQNTGFFNPCRPSFPLPLDDSDFGASSVLSQHAPPERWNTGNDPQISAYGHINTQSDMNENYNWMNRSSLPRNDSGELQPGK